MTNVIDELLADIRPDGDDPAVRAGLRRGQDLKALSEQADQGILDDLFSQGEHNKAATFQAQNRSGLMAAPMNWRQANAADSLPHTVDDVQGGQFKDASALDPQGLDTIGKKHVNDAEVKKFIGDQLSLGKTPAQVAASLQRLAAQAVFDNTAMHDFLTSQSGMMGMAYLEPNRFNKECKASLAYIRANGNLKAASVKRIAACDGCTECKCSPDGSSKCALYGRPLVGNAQELGRVVANLTGGSMKRAALVAKHNGVSEKAPLPGHQAQVLASRPAPVVAQQVAGAGVVSRFDAEEFRAANSSFSKASVVAALHEGQTFPAIYATAKKAHGTQTADRVCRAYLDGLKNSGARINLASVDCSMLTRRLASTETILGTSKCAGCTLRNGMHCGKTGGTILSFPGMEKDPATNKRAALAQAPETDAVMFMASLGMMSNQDLNIEYSQPRNLLDVQ